MAPASWTLTRNRGLCAGFWITMGQRPDLHRRQAEVDLPCPDRYSDSLQPGNSLANRRAGTGRKVSPALALFYIQRPRHALSTPGGGQPRPQRPDHASSPVAASATTKVATSSVAEAMPHQPRQCTLLYRGDDRQFLPVCDFLE